MSVCLSHKTHTEWIDFRKIAKWNVLNSLGVATSTYNNSLTYIYMYMTWEKYITISRILFVYRPTSRNQPSGPSIVVQTVQDSTSYQGKHAYVQHECLSANVKNKWSMHICWRRKKQTSYIYRFRSKFGRVCSHSFDRCLYTQCVRFNR